MRIKFIICLLIASITVYSQPVLKKVLIDGSGSPIVMLPGALAPIETLDIPAKDLAARYKVIRMENLNVQYATRNLLLPRNYSIQMETESVMLTLDSLGIKEPVVLAGSSYGGLIALNFALRYPTRTKSIVLMEPPFLGLLKAKKESPEGLDKAIEITKELKPQAEITEQQVERWRCLGFNCDSMSVKNLPQWKAWLQTKNRLRGLSATIDYKSDSKKLKALKMPVLIITGTQTVIMHKRINELLHAEIPGSKLIFIESGHSIPTTAPKELVKDILEFLN